LDIPLLRLGNTFLNVMGIGIRHEEDI
jgi:hypothetical protein